MSRSIFSAAHFNDEAAAYAFVEARLWANGRVCPHCGVVDKSGALKGKSDRIGSYKCYACRKKFTVKVGTIFEDSHVQMRDWLTAIHLMCSSKKGVSANQLHRSLGVTLKTGSVLSAIASARPCAKAVWRLWAVTVALSRSTRPISAGRKAQRSSVVRSTRMQSLLLWSAAVRLARSTLIVATKDAILPIVKANIDRETHVMTDQSNVYNKLGQHFAGHDSVDHSRGEYGYRDRRNPQSFDRHKHRRGLSIRSSSAV